MCGCGPGIIRVPSASAGDGPPGAGRAIAQIPHAQRPDLHDVTGLERLLGPPRAVDEDPIAAAQVANRHRGRRGDELGVAARQQAVVDADVARRIAPDDQSLDEQELALTLSVVHDQYLAHRVSNILVSVVSARAVARRQQAANERRGAILPGRRPGGRRLGRGNRLVAQRGDGGELRVVPRLQHFERHVCGGAIHRLEERRPVRSARERRESRLQAPHRFVAARLDVGPAERSPQRSMLLDGGERLPVAFERGLDDTIGGRVMAAPGAAELLEQLTTVLLPIAPALSRAPS